MKQIVIGLGFGDEGKGLVVDWLASKNLKADVVRYCGGHQAGHCVRIGNDTHIFSNFGSGTLRGNRTIWNARTCDPVGFCNEWDSLEKKPVIMVNHKCAITTPFEKVINLKHNLLTNHGTIGVGFGATIEREEKNYHLYFQDLFYPEILKAKMSELLNWYEKTGVFIRRGDLKEFYYACERIISLVSVFDPSETQIYESSQGLMLDMEYGIFPNVTRSKVGTQEIALQPEDELYLITRAYQTRHGNGWCSSHCFSPVGGTETNKYNEHQGYFKTRMLDVDLLNYAINIDNGIREFNKKNLVITCLDHFHENYSLVHKGDIINLNSEGEFIDYIMESLNCEFHHVYLSHGPRAEDIVQSW